MVIDLRLRIFLKADSPMDVTLLGMIIEVRFEQAQNAQLPIDFTLLGIVTETIRLKL